MGQDTAVSDGEAAIDGAIRDYQAGRLIEAAARCHGVLLRCPRDRDASNLLAIMACDRGEPAAALARLAEPLAAAAVSPALLNTRARVLAALGRWDAAEAAYRLAWSADTGCGPVANNLGCLLRDRGRAGEAIEWFETAYRLVPQSADVARNLAGALACTHRYDAALAVYRQVIALDPAAAGSYAQCGAMLLSAGRATAAEPMLRAALQRDPISADAWNNLGLVVRGEGQPGEAMACFRNAIRYAPGLADAHYNLGCLLLLANRQDEARACHERALAADPMHGPAMWARCMVELPILYATAEGVDVQRTRYTQQLAVLERQAADPAKAQALAASAGASQPFFLPYQGHCDRALQARYGALMAHLLARPAGPIAELPVRGERIRLGIVSGFFHEHTIWRLMLRGWLRHIDRARFDVAAYATSPLHDGQTEVARQFCPRFVTGPAEAVRAAVVADRPHVLLYPEIGIDRVAARLGAERLAPLQCVTWGQPQTTGLPTMDAFLSSALMEPEGAARNYGEHLVALPGLGICYEADERCASACTRAEFGLRDSSVVFWCGQAIYKYLPQHDDVLARIAERVGDCQFLFIGFAEDPAVTGHLERRLARAFGSHGLDSERYVRIVDAMPQPRFLGSVRLADIVLDSIGWSGGKSTLDMLAEAPAIVTLAGPFMRGRHTAAILTAAGVAETIATSVDGYVDLAVRLACDPVWRAAVRRRMATGHHRCIGDVAPIRAMEDWLARRLTRDTGTDQQLPR